MNFLARITNTLPKKRIPLDFASFGIFVKKMYKAELKIAQKQRDLLVLEKIFS